MEKIETVINYGNHIFTAYKYCQCGGENILEQKEAERFVCKCTKCGGSITLKVITPQKGGNNGTAVK